MTDIPADMKAESDVWFAQVEKLLGEAPTPEEDWAELWFDGYTPEEAVAGVALLCPHHRQGAANERRLRARYFLFGCDVVRHVFGLGCSEP